LCTSWILLAFGELASGYRHPWSLSPVPYGFDAIGCQCVKPNGNRKWIPHPWFLSKN
jgi:hypothetical protein